MRSKLETAEMGVWPSGEPLSLLVMSERGTLKWTLPRSGELTIGRDAACEVRLDDCGVSRRHAKLIVGERLQLLDLGSRNGTRIGDRLAIPNEPVEVSLRDAIRIGDNVLVVQSTHMRAEDGSSSGQSAAKAPVLGATSPPTDSVDLDSLRELVPNLDRVAAGTINVLIQGETGVGKEVLAHAIHRLSPRAAGPIVCLNCCALSDSLIESEIFGHERGAFTGALRSKTGFLEGAHGGTLFLDEVGEMSSAFQTKFLRVLERKEVMRVGGLRPRSIDARIIAATNRDLQAEMVAGRFRRDLYFRLNGLRIVMSPLRERLEDVEPLVRHFVARASEASRRQVPTIAADVMSLLKSYRWPGNIRELRNVAERAVLLCDGDAIGPQHLPAEVGGANVPNELDSVPPVTQHPLKGDFAREPRATDPTAKERDWIVDALRVCRGNQSQAAKLLGISRRTLVSRMTRYDLPRPRKNRVSLPAHIEKERR
ncbi:MAG: sigma 54-interacting transcriptional regulator [Polyangiaceae bacterium]